jgi:transposase
MKKERRIFSAEFKQEAVALVVEQGYSCAAAGRSLGVRGNLISRWKRLLKDDASDTFPGNGKRTAEQQRMSVVKQMEQNSPLDKPYVCSICLTTDTILNRRNR